MNYANYKRMSGAGLAGVIREEGRIVMNKAQFDPTNGIRQSDRIQKFLETSVDELIAEFQTSLDDLDKLKADIVALPPE